MFYEILITIMKKNIWIWALAAVTLTTACSKDNDPVAQEPEQTVTEDDFESPDGQVVIQLAGGSYMVSPNTTVTRAPISNTTFAAGNTMIGIYAASTTGAWTTADNLLLDNRKAVVTSQVRTEKDGADESKTDESTVTSPYKISLYDVTGTTPSKVEYYPMVSNKNFTFYGYAPYNNSYSTIKTAGGATITFTGFNGSEDIIWGKGEANPISAGEIWTADNHETNPTAINGYNAKYIRMLKYHYELNTDETAPKKHYPWVPNITFAHKLVQFKFYVIPATKQSSADKENAKKLFVSNIRLQNHGTPVLSISDGSLTYSGNQELKMRAVNGGSTFTDEELTTSVKPTDNTIVGYLLVKPGETEYNLLIDISPFNNDNSENEDQKQTDIPVRISLGENQAFEAGSSYNIKLGIYAMQQIEADASLTEWTDKGDVNIDVE